MVGIGLTFKGRGRFRERGGGGGAASKFLFRLIWPLAGVRRKQTSPRVIKAS